MRRRPLIVAAALGGLLPRLAVATPRPVVIELFTSQGCSSCPPADALLGQLAQRPGVIALAWHVDYWDRLGWRDRFAFREATLRQRGYAARLGSEVFTPAMVVDGSAIVVGSRPASVEAAIQAASPLPVAVTLTDSGATTTVEIAPARTPVCAQLIIYDREQATDVGAGENGGARLREYRIVRRVETLAAWDGEARSFRLPRAVPGQGQSILLQSADLRILGAVDQPPG